MSHFDRLYDETEHAQVQFVGFTSDTTRFDFALIYTDMFFGKTLVVNMQMGRSALLSDDDLQNIDDLQTLFQVNDEREAEELAIFFKSMLPSQSLRRQY